MLHNLIKISRKKVLLRMVGSKENRICLFALSPKLMLLNEYGMPHCVLPGCTAVLMEVEFSIED